MKKYEAFIWDEGLAQLNRTRLLGELKEAMKGGQEKHMETKSRYEVIADLEDKKRRLIVEKNSFDEQLKLKERTLKEKEREKSDTVIQFDREIDDLKEDIVNYKKSMVERKQTADELIKSMNESLERFGKLQDKQDKQR